MKRANKSTNTKKYVWDESIRTMLFAILLALTFRSFLFEPFHIPSGSMKDTLLVGDYIFVSKYSYGYSRYSFPLGIDLFDGRIANDDRPQRGDVAVFRLPSNPKLDFIKRVVGLPGDRIQMREGILYINGAPVDKRRVEDFTDRVGENATEDIPRYRETLPNGVSHYVLDASVRGMLDTTRQFIVPEGHYFMLGDNRDNSADSRTSHVGLIPEQYLIGRAEIILFSIDDRTNIWKVWDWVWAFRSERVLQVIR